MNPNEAASTLREKFGVEPVVEGAVVAVALPTDRWREAAEVAKTILGCRYYGSE